MPDLTGIDEALAAIAGYEGAAWSRPWPGLWRLRGESADGCLDWTVETVTGDGFILTRECGWYTQTGDAQDVAELVRLARAMDAAAKALDSALEARDA